MNILSYLKTFTSKIFSLSSSKRAFQPYNQIESTLTNLLTLLITLYHSTSQEDLELKPPEQMTSNTKSLIAFITLILSSL